MLLWDRSWPDSRSSEWIRWLRSCCWLLLPSGLLSVTVVDVSHNLTEEAAGSRRAGELGSHYTSKLLLLLFHLLMLLLLLLLRELLLLLIQLLLLWEEF